LKKITSN